jgi:hypothetical protein
MTAEGDDRRILLNKALSNLYENEKDDFNLDNDNKYHGEVL